MSWGVWDGNGFVGLRYKFNEARLDKEFLNHTARGAIRFLCDLPDGIEVEEGWMRPEHYETNLRLLDFLKRIEKDNMERRA